MLTDLDLRSPSQSRGWGAAGRPVLLATMGVPLDPEASAFAIDTAVESGTPLTVANVTPLEPLSLSIRLGYDALEEFTPEVSRSLRRSADLAASLGVRVERLRVRSPRPVTALLELVSELDSGMLVFGPDRREMRRARYRRVTERVTANCPCLVWLAAASSAP